MFTRAASIISAFGMGYSVAHVVVNYFIVAMILESVGVKMPKAFDSALGAAQVLNVMVLSIGIGAFIAPREETQTSTWRMTFLVGVVVFAAGVAAKLVF